MQALRTLVCIVMVCNATWFINPAISQSLTSCTLFEEQEGLLVMEAESVFPTDSWSLRNDINDATGNGYYEWKHGDTDQGIDAAGGGVLTYSFTITSTGSYRFLLRSSSPDNTEHNDVWVRFPDNPATGIRTSGQGTIDIAPNAWFKVYQNTSSQNWKWDARTVDFDPHNIYVAIEEPGTYAVELSGRSTLFKIDRLVLFHEQVPYTDATRVTNEASACLETETIVLRQPDAPQSLLPGVFYGYYEGQWTNLPDFSALTPIQTGVATGFDITARQRDDDFGFFFKGLVQAPVDGLYTFFTVSNAGSQLFIGDTLVVDNDGRHPARERSGRIGLTAGLHEISVLYFEDIFAQSLTVAWIPPGGTRQPLGEGMLFYDPNDISEITSVEQPSLPATTTLYPNYPDPFNPTTTITFDLATESPVRLSLYTTTGELVEVLLDDMRPAGPVEVTFTAASTLTSGLYIYRLETREQVLYGTMTLIK